MVHFTIKETMNFEKLVPFFIENRLEFEEGEKAPAGLVKCWEITQSDDSGTGETGVDSGRLIGALALAKREEEFVMEGLAITPEYRRCKLGKALLERGIEEALKCGAKQIYLVARAPEFFRKQGFVTVPPEEAPTFFECLTCPQYGTECHPEVMHMEL